MTRAQVVRILKQVRYKPGWKIRLDGDDIEVTANVTDAYRPRRKRKPIEQPHAYVVDATKYLSDDALLERIFDACEQLEIHECTEWFKYRGRRPFYQHR